MGQCRKPATPALKPQSGKFREKGPARPGAVQRQGEQEKGAASCAATPDDTIPQCGPGKRKTGFYWNTGIFSKFLPDPMQPAYGIFWLDLVK